MKKKIIKAAVLTAVIVCIAVPLGVLAWRFMVPHYCWPDRVCLTDKFQNGDGSYSIVIDEEFAPLRNGKSAYTLTCTREQYDVAEIGDLVYCGRRQIELTHRGWVEGISLARSAAP